MAVKVLVGCRGAVENPVKINERWQNEHEDEH